MGAQNTFESATKELLVLLPGIQDSSHDFSWEMRHGRKNEHEFLEKVIEIFSKVVDFFQNGADFFQNGVDFLAHPGLRWNR